MKALVHTKNKLLLSLGDNKRTSDDDFAAMRVDYQNLIQQQQKIFKTLVNKHHFSLLLLKL